MNVSRRKAMLVLSSPFLLSRPINGASDGPQDGNWWITQAKLQKLDYLIGFFDGMELGNRFSYWKMGATDECFVKVAESYSEFSKKYFRNVTAGQMLDGLDSFYSDYRNRRIQVFAGVWLVSNGIAGTPEAELQKMVESWRKNSG